MTWRAEFAQVPTTPDTRAERVHNNLGQTIPHKTSLHDPPLLWTTLSQLSQRHRCCHHRIQCSASSLGAKSAVVVGCLWPRTEPEVWSCKWLVLHSCKKEQRDALLPCLHWLRCCFSIPWQREEDCLANLGCLWWGFWYLQQTQPVPTGSECWRPGTLEKFVTMMYDRSSTAEGVDNAKLDMFARKQRTYKANQSSAEAACETCCLPGGLHLKSVSNTSIRNAGSCQMGLDQERRTVADRLDRAPIHCKVASSWSSVDASRNAAIDAHATALVWPARHCVAADARFRRVVVHSSRQQDNKWQTSIGLLPTCTFNNTSDWGCLYGHFLP